MRCLLLLVLMGFWLQAWCQEKPDYHPPMKSELRLAGNFGELRSGHFHTGIDLKTFGRKGLPIKAIDSGYVSRIKIQEGGYGKALYIDHPDGNTSVYAHLERFAPPIERFLRKVQYEQERGPIELYPRKGLLPVDRGETVAYSGNSGSSTAPHLHFEIRNTSSEKPIDPLLFGFDISDHRAPVFNGLRIRSRSERTEEGAKGKTFGVRQVAPGVFRLAGKQGLELSGTIGFAVRSTDRASGTPNPLGTQKVRVEVDGSPLFAFRIDTLDFSKKNYINSHIEHPYYYSSGRHYHRCHLLPHNELPIYDLARNGGWLNLTSDSSYQVRIEAFDRSGNRSELRFRIKGAPGKGERKLASGNELEWDRKERVKKEGISLEFQPKTLYRNIQLRYDRKDETDPKALSPTHSVHSPETPLQKPFEARIRLDSLPSEAADKLFILSEDERWSTRAYKASLEEGQAIAKIERFGELKVRADSTPPSIKPLKIRRTVDGAKAQEFRFRIDDGLSGIEFYGAWIDGQWRIPYYDPKRKLLSIDVGDPENPLVKGVRRFLLKVRDRAGNERSFVKEVKVK